MLLFSMNFIPKPIATVTAKSDRILAIQGGWVSIERRAPINQPQFEGTPNDLSFGLGSEIPPERLFPQHEGIPVAIGQLRLGRLIAERGQLHPQLFMAIWISLLGKCGFFELEPTKSRTFCRGVNSNQEFLTGPHTISEDAGNGRVKRGPLVPA